MSVPLSLGAAKPPPLPPAGASFWVCIASGPSAHCKADLNQIADARMHGLMGIMTVNNAYQLITPDAIYSHDSWWWRNHYDSIKDLGAVCYCGDPEYARLFKLHRVVSRHHVGLSRNRSYVTHGGNSGHQAVNMLRNIGARKIALVGFDMGRVKGKKRFHPPHKRTEHEPEYKCWRQNMARMAGPLRKEGVEVTDCSLRGHLNCFQKMSIREWINTLDQRNP